MTTVQNAPDLWPLINFNINFSYYIVASSAAVIYDWALTIGQELELIWVSRVSFQKDIVNSQQRHHWSLMTVLYIGVRYIGIVYIIINMLQLLPTVSLTDEGCDITYLALNWISVVTYAMLGAIMITRLYAMYQQSRNMLIFLTLFLTAVTIACGVMIEILNKHTVVEEFILSGTYMCYCTNSEADALVLLFMTWILSTVWEVLALCLAVWIAVKHLRELQRSPTGWAVGDCFAVLMRTHVIYFASFVAVSCFDLGYLSPQYLDSLAVGPQIYDGIRQILSVMQLFVLGPRLILSVRQSHAKSLDNCDAGADMIPMSFQERTYASTGSDIQY